MKIIWQREWYWAPRFGCYGRVMIETSGRGNSEMLETSGRGSSEILATVELYRTSEDKFDLEICYPGQGEKFTVLGLVVGIGQVTLIRIPTTLAESVKKPPPGMDDAAVTREKF